MKILIVDDESLARQRMRDLLTDLGETDIVGEAA
ncbi:MAG TPA: DNA-binding response regulator, partial [Gammaproteobacteria bacterium]|nr:DNA-binding response regulator [Gammaproteobacteria bacterium]